MLFRATVRYDGAPFAGWQLQPGRRTVQGDIEAALARIAGTPVRIQGAGRTDAGVHALGQVFSGEWPGTPPERLRHALSSMLSPDIRITEFEMAPPGFNARFSAKAKRYAYAMDFAREPDPFSARYAWHVPYAIDFDRIRACLPVLHGTHDFAGFQSAGSQMQTTVRTIYDISLHRGGITGPLDSDTLWRLEFYGDAFLYKMVRNITGTLIEIGRGRFDASFIEEALARGGPFRGHCAPPHGLALVRVEY
ncbi:MAG: tRNA pseudouridine(38-40) synthase TruA [Candidatus Hydrogenedentes bacterium]|nr:tRNA pseudouridine(38-40) synthase TruA [Candidatus Hydrogenedentota bacterium]